MSRYLKEILTFNTAYNFVFINELKRAKGPQNVMQTIVFL